MRFLITVSSVKFAVTLVIITPALSVEVIQSGRVGANMLYRWPPMNIYVFFRKPVVSNGNALFDLNSIDWHMFTIPKSIWGDIHVLASN